MEYSSGVKVMFYNVPSKCHFFIFRFYVHVTHHVLYIYIYIVNGFIGFYLISLEYAKIQTKILLSSSKLVTVVFFKNLLSNSYIYACA